MFICRECEKKAIDISGFMRSFGTCEICCITSDCLDAKIYKFSKEIWEESNKKNSDLALKQKIAFENKLTAYKDKEISHWKANHADMVKRCEFLSQRPDLPVERIHAYKDYEILKIKFNELLLSHQKLAIQNSKFVAIINPSNLRYIAERIAHKAYMRPVFEIIEDEICDYLLELFNK
jgi:hypothetical protein